jgi:uncharacterized repeat protein (TIGR01451 family)
MKRELPKGKSSPTMLVRFFGLLALCLTIITGPFSVMQPARASEGYFPNAQTSETENVIFRGVSTAVQFDISQPLRNIQPLEITPGSEFNDFDLPSDLEGLPGPQDFDPSVQDWVGSTEIPSPIVSFDGPSNLANVSPPDPVGDVGPNHYVAMSNLYFAIYDKSGNLLYGPAANNTLWAGFGGACQNENAGDPIVVYDQFADRWMLTQFTANGPTYYNCVALSTSGDPTSTYYRYAFSTGTNFPDYPKYGVWSDAYYISTREFSGSGFAGIGAYALNRDQMLVGNPTPQVVSFLATPGSTPYNVGDGLLPTDLDGNVLPPAGSPNYFMGSMDNGGPYGAPQDALTLWKFHVDWVTPGNSSFTLASTITVDPFDSIFPCSPGSRNCIPQPGTSNKIDILSYRQRPMWRLAYRNFGTHESLVTNQSVEASANMAGIRWYEIRDPNGSPFIYQQSTYAPGTSDGIHRWMGSIAMDAVGNMALGYSASNATTTFPSSWYTGRLVDDPLGTMPQGEGVIINGTGSQTASARWGDYTSMNVDPVDDCTFWYVNEYLPVTSPIGWRLHIGAFKFPSCTTTPTADLSIDKTGSADPIAPGDALTYTLSVTNNGPSEVMTSTIALENLSSIAINDNGPANPYPAIINASGLMGTIAKATVTLNQVSHTYPDDIDILLVGPGGENSLLMSDAGNGLDIVSVNLTFDDAASTTLPDNNQILSGDYQPTDYTVGDTFPAPAPAGPYTAALSNFIGGNPNGDWGLYIVDDVGGDVGSISGGWSLTLVLSPSVSISDNLPAGMTYTGFSAPGWICTPTGQLITCTSDTLPVGAPQEIQLFTNAPLSTGYILNTAEITSTTPDPNTDNNSSTLVTLVDTAPIANDDGYETAEDTPLFVAAPGVLTNDNDPDSDSLVVNLESGPSNGVLTLNVDGSFTYTPTTEYSGFDQFTYSINDGYLSDIASAVITVTSVNDAPVGASDNYTTGEDTPLVVAAPGVLVNDTDIEGDPLEASLDSGPVNGTISLSMDGSFVYTPTLNYNGPDMFTYILSDGALTDTVTVDLVIDPINDNPTVDAGNDQTVDEGDVVQYNGSFIDPGMRAPSAETIEWDFGDGITMTGTLTPSHEYQENGVYTVTLTVTDDLGGSGSDQLVVTVNNVAPNLESIADLAVLEGETFTVTGIFSDPGILDTFVIEIEWAPGMTDTINLAAGLNSFDATHVYEIAGNYTVNITVTDDDGGSSTRSFVVTVSSPFSKFYLPIVAR